MKIVQPDFKVYVHGDTLTPALGIKLLQWVEFNARISHRTEDRQTPESWYGFINAHVLGHGDWSVCEHSSATTIFKLDRGITHELVRHRIGAYTQESTRFVRYGKRELEFIEPVWPTRNYEGHEPCRAPWLAMLRECEKTYLGLLEIKASPQMARSVLPNALAAEISATFNLRNWRHFFLMRTSRETHEDFRRVTIPLLETFKQNIPLLFDDIQSNERQIDNLRKPR